MRLSTGTDDDNPRGVIFLSTRTRRPFPSPLGVAVRVADRAEGDGDGASLGALLVSGVGLRKRNEGVEEAGRRSDKRSDGALGRTNSPEVLRVLGRGTGEAKRLELEGLGEPSGPRIDGLNTRRGRVALVGVDTVEYRDEVESDRSLLENVLVGISACRTRCS